MIALTAKWGGDLTLSPAGDLAAVPVEIEAQQRIIRRLLTNPGSYIWHLDYGAGLGRQIGKPYVARSVENTVIDHLRRESLVSARSPPSVQISGVSDQSSGALSMVIHFDIVTIPGRQSVAIGLED